MNEIKKGWNAALTHHHFKPKIITVPLKMTKIFNLKVLEKKEKKNLFLADIAIAKMKNHNWEKHSVSPCFELFTWSPCFENQLNSPALKTSWSVKFSWT